MKKYIVSYVFVLIFLSVLSKQIFATSTEPDPTEVPAAAECGAGFYECNRAPSFCCAIDTSGIGSNNNGGDGGGGTAGCPAGKVSNGLCEAGLRPITVANCCKAITTTGPTATPIPGSGGTSCSFTGCSTDHPGYSYTFSTTCSGACTLGCGGKWPAWPSNYACLDGGVCNAAKKCVPDTCSPACKTGEYCSAEKKCISQAAVCTPACKAGETCNAEKKCVPSPTTASCPGFVKASVAPSTARPLDQVTVRCDYGKRLDCLSVTGAGLTNCRYSRYEGTDNIFTCDAGPNAGYYDDAKCVTKAGTADQCCDSSSKAGDLTILGTEVHYDQEVILPYGTYTLFARVFSVISKGKGVRVSLICNSDSCTTAKAKNAEVASIAFPETKDFVNKSLSVPLTGTGDDKHYLIRVSADKGSEAYFDAISFKDTKSPIREYVQNGEFDTTQNSSIATKQPTYWGEGDNKVGYYYGSVADVPAPTSSINFVQGGPTGLPGTGTTGSVTLNIKIKLQGITKKPSSAAAIPVQVRLAGGGLSAATAYSTGQFSVNDAGEWTGKVSFDSVPSGSGYRVYVKAPKHIAKKICDTTPTESKGGEYHCGDGKISISASENSFDFSKIVQLGGDLPEAGGKQNGIIDAYDTTFVRTNLGSSDAAKSSTGDINADGVIDTQDYSMIVQALSIKFDEE